MSTVNVVAQRTSASLVLPALAPPAAAANMPTPGAPAAGLSSTSATVVTTVASPKPQQSNVVGIKRLRRGDHKEGRTTKQRQRTLTKTMEPPVLSFYGEQPVPLPSRFAHLKRRLVTGHEPALEASWGRLLDALRDEMKHIESHGTGLIPWIDFRDVSSASKVTPFRESVKRYGIGVVRGVVDESDAQSWVDETKTYLETKHEFKPPPAQDPTCFDFFWSPCQVRARAHPNVLRAQKFAMSLWETSDDDRLATRFPICYADRIRIDTNTTGSLNGTAGASAVEDPLSPATSSTLIAQVDNGSLERWEPDGYGRSGCYDAIWKGEWESYNPWDPTGRVNATSDLYNGAGACSMFRMFQGILALTTVEPGMVRLLPSPKLSTAYFLLRPFFSPKKPHPEKDAEPAAWDEYLDASNWALDEEQTTTIHGAVPGHAQRVTEVWHPHLQLSKSLVAPPTLKPGDYIVWHPDEPYAFERAPPSTSMLVYTPAAPLTQTNALFLARQRKAFLRGHPGPDFDSTGSGLGSEAPHTGRLEEKDIAAVGGEEGLQAMGLAPWIISKSAVEESRTVTPTEESGKEVGDDAQSASSDKSGSTISAAEAEVVKMANIILFPDRYDFWMPSRTGTPSAEGGVKGRDKEKGKEKEKDASSPA
ncbi:uncharacterized protein BCR38DRAFT_443830 [Pseudomassariella vexata]|uniref:DUF1479 domain protein n=1 Tax=Pseudomassariella vexata TaxID=1141098 RepID=A0A1Y2DLB5_9PEZI|nr:uncharacterized protein BCR38DRAFT_443830 [Pseudomassariella vexata]ORY60070.1 hypothetical protein BCR38DRAFT_443830 [Pseudomassariella vexata]